MYFLCLLNFRVLVVLLGDYRATGQKCCQPESNGSASCYLRKGVSGWEAVCIWWREELVCCWIPQLETKWIPGSPGRWARARQKVVDLRCPQPEIPKIWLMIKCHGIMVESEFSMNWLTRIPFVSHWSPGGQETDENSLVVLIQLRGAGREESSP